MVTNGWFEIGGRQEGHLKLDLELDTVESYLDLELDAVESYCGTWKKILVWIAELEWMRLIWKTGWTYEQDG